VLKINWNYIKGLTLLLLVLFLYGFSYQKNKIKKIKDIVIGFEEGTNFFISHEIVNKLLIQNNQSAKNQAKSVIDLHQLETNVLSHPMVEDATVYLTVDGLLKTKIKQRTPIARVVSKTKSYYIDKQAKKMPLSENYTARVLLIYGNVADENINNIYYLVTTILGDEFLKKQIISVTKMPSNEFVLKTREGNQKILLGTTDDLEIKFKNLKSFFTKTITDNTLDNYSTINLKYHKQVVCTKI
jgi:cell division protein FtsQ